MKYEEIISTLIEIVNNDNIKKEGLKLIYEIDSEEHKKLNEHIFYHRGGVGEFTFSDVIEVGSDGVIIQILKK